MDTNINNYNINEILKLIKVSTETCRLDNVYSVILTILQQINHTEELKNKNNILTFFIKCFYKICHAYSFIPTDSMNKNINGHLNNELLTYSVTELMSTSMSLNDNMITHDEPYIGSLPVKVPDIVSVGTNQDKYVRGLVNPLKRETITNILTINSKFRNDENSTSTDFYVMLNDPFNNVVSLKLASLELMNSYYAISDYLKSNIFTVETYTLDILTNAVADCYRKEIYLSEGGYNADSLFQTLNAYFDADPQLSMIETENNMIKGKIIFRLKATPPTPPPAGKKYAFNLIFTISEDVNRPLYNNFGWLLGFTQKKYTFLKNYCSTATAIKEIGFNPDMPLDLTGTKFFLLEVTDYNNNAPAVLKYNMIDKYSFNIKDILAKVPNVSSPYCIIFEDASDRIFKTRNYFGPVRLQKLRIRLLDENGKVINLNNSDMVVSFEVESIEIPYKNML